MTGLTEYGSHDNNTDNNAQLKINIRKIIEFISNFINGPYKFI